MIDHTLTKKRSLGKLRVAHKTKERSPDMTGTLCLQRHTAALILRAFQNSNDHEAVCNIAAWVNHDHEGQYLTVELSPKYAYLIPKVSKRAASTSFSAMRRIAVEHIQLETNQRSRRLSSL